MLSRDQSLRTSPRTGLGMIVVLLVMLLAGADVCAAHPHHPETGHAAASPVHCEPNGHHHQVERFDDDLATTPAADPEDTAEAVAPAAVAVHPRATTPTGRPAWARRGADLLIGLCISRT